MQRKIRIIADSSANLESDKPGFASVPLRIVAGDREYVDGEGLDVDAMLDELDAHKGPSATACPGIGDWFEAFGDADDVVGVTITGTLSGCHNSAVAAAQQHMAAHPGRRVFIFDSLSTGPELELIVEKLRELAGQGCPFEELREKVASYAQRTRLGFSLESLSNMAKNGRVSSALATAAGLLGIRIVGRASAKGASRRCTRAAARSARSASCGRPCSRAALRAGRCASATPTTRRPPQSSPSW